MVKESLWSPQLYLLKRKSYVCSVMSGRGPAHGALPESEQCSSQRRVRKAVVRRKGDDGARPRGEPGACGR
jgi:hypothetical protein